MNFYISWKSDDNLGGLAREDYQPSEGFLPSLAVYTPTGGEKPVLESDLEGWAGMGYLVEE